MRLWVWLLALGISLQSVLAETPARLRTIVTTDGEADDRCSMIRFLLYANEWDIRGLIHSSSKHHWKGDAAHPAKKWTDVSWLDRQLALYGEVYPNLKRHDANYPTPDYLKSQVFVGNIAYEGDMEQPTAGSDRIAEVLLKKDSSPVWLQAWGGANTIARALKTIQERHPESMPEVTRKTRLFLIASQDTTTEDYILKNWPGIFIVRSSGAYLAIAYRWEQVMTSAEQKLFDRDWMGKNILQGHGALCAAYEVRKDGAFRSEGDSPAFMHLIDVGLRNLEQPNYGGWGGRFEWADDQWRSAPDDGSITRPIMRWATAFQNDWAARGDWCVKSYREANHPPQARLAHASDLAAKPGERVKLSARHSSDPDQNELAFRWWHYPEAGSHQSTITIETADQPETSFLVPVSARPKDTIHVICEVTDNGTPALTRYQRVIVTVTDKE
ncbi:MAG TPA: DUF1593 domain-containing protein [Verrucomicrobiae bacterium]|nr:DUF1593 domain-containing protein [Verrucomicrobiae bacterium]